MAGIGDQSISSSVQAMTEHGMVQASLGRRTQSSVSLSVVREYIYMAANSCYHDRRLTSETTEERVSRLHQMSVHQCDRQTGMSDY